MTSLALEVPKRNGTDEPGRQINMFGASILQSGPANATAADDPEAVDADEVDGHDVQCAAALDGGIDDVTPVQLWDAVVRKYKVAQICEAELARLERMPDLSKKDKLEQERALAIAEATTALAKPH